MTEKHFAEKKKKLKTMLERLRNWDEKAESILLLLDKNEKEMEAIALIDEQLTQVEKDNFLAENEELIQKVIEYQRTFIKKINEKKTLLKEQISQMNQQKKVVNNYIDKESSLFVDRDV